LQANFRLETILEKERIFGKGELQKQFFWKSYKLTMINIVGLGKVYVGVVGAKNLCYN